MSEDAVYKTGTPAPETVEPSSETPVPVETYAHISNPRKRAFLRAYGELGNVTDSAACAGVTRFAHPQWMQDDPEYAEAWQVASEVYTDSCRALVRERRAKSDLILMFETKKHDPSYRDNQSLQVNVDARSMNVDGLLAQILQAREQLAKGEPEVIEEGGKDATE